jgi:epoxyqueuosine reductase
VAGIEKRLIDLCKEAGFPLAGVVDIDLAAEHFQKHFSRYKDWLDVGFHGDMAYLKRGIERRENIRLVFPEVKSILCVAIPYDSSPAGFEDSSRGPKFARYVQGRDYHLEIKNLLDAVMQKLAIEDKSLKWKVCVDTSAVLERSWAAICGLGWIGKNSMLVHPQLGSYLFIGEVLLNQETGVGPRLLPNYCGNCQKCLDACPTSAFDSNLGLDSRKCISYWTIEKRGELELSDQQKKALGTWVAGCDRCQEVCPFNSKAVKIQTLQPSMQFTWDELLNESEINYKKRVQNSALDRIKFEDFKRNLKTAHDNALQFELTADCKNKISESAND